MYEQVMVSFTSIYTLGEDDTTRVYNKNRRLIWNIKILYNQENRVES